MNCRWLRLTSAIATFYVLSLLSIHAKGPPYQTNDAVPVDYSILDAVKKGLELPTNTLAESRKVLTCFGNMSSATVIFVLQRMMHHARTGQCGCATSFGPGLTEETLRFHVA